MKQESFITILKMVMIIFLGTFFDDSDNSDDSDSIISNVVQFFYNYANVSEEGGSDVLYSPGATI